MSEALTVAAPGIGRQVARPGWAGAGATVLVGGLGLAEGGYFPASWGWAGVLLCWTGAVAVVLGGVARPGRLELALAGGLTGLTAWIAMSALWAESPADALPESHRSLLYAATALAGVLLLTRRAVPGLARGVLAGIVVVCTYGLATRLFPERLGRFDPVAGYRLAEPIGYWNGLGLLAAIGTLLALGVVARSERLLPRALGAAAVPVLLATLYFTFGRAAWIALFLGLLVSLALDPRRLQLAVTGLALAPAAALAVWLSARADALGREDALLLAATRDGHRLAVALVVLGALSAGFAVALAVVAQRVATGPSVRRVGHASLVAVLAIAVATGLVAAGGPADAVTKAHDAFVAPTPHAGDDLSDRLFSFSGNGRAELWEAAARERAAHRLLGGGAGSFEAHWLLSRDVPLKVRDAHSLYLETLAELGPVGLGLLLLALGAPLLGAWRARSLPLTAPLAGAYAAYLVHAGVDWDWELAAVTVSAIVIGCALALSAQRHDRPRTGRGGRVLACAGLLVLGGWSLVGLVGSSALTAANRATADGHFEAAVDHARTAHRFAPWSAAPWRALGNAELGRGEIDAAARAFRSAVAVDPSDYAAWLDLARATDDPERAVALDRATALNPLSPELARFREGLDLEIPIAAADSKVESP